MPISIDGKRIIVTGGARGIAADAARHFVEEGAHVVTFDIRDDLGEKLAREMTAAGPGRLFFRHVDVTDEDGVRSGVDWAVRQIGGLDAVFNIAGIDIPAFPEDNTEELWDKIIAVNLKGVAHVCQAVFPHLKEGGGSIVNFGSDGGLMDGPLNESAYGATKGAVISYTRILANAWGRYGIRANTVNPAIKTPMYWEHLESLDEAGAAAFKALVNSAIPLGGDLGDGPTDIAPVLAFLASDASRFITAQIIGVNGGLNAGR